MTGTLYGLQAWLIGVLWFATQLAFGQVAPASDLQEPIVLEQGKPLERGLNANQTHTYGLTLTKGQFFYAVVSQRSIDVIVQVFGPDGAKLAEIDSPNGGEGDEPVALVAPTGGFYRIDIRPREKDTLPGRYVIMLKELLSAPAYAARLAEIRRMQRAVIGWLKTNAILLKTVETGDDRADLQPLKNTLKDVRFIGLGEATHGSREFFQVKHRLLDFLVREMGFRVLAIEGSYTGLQGINDYVMGRTDDGAKALDGQGFWIWNTEEMRAMMDWARSYNTGISTEQQVKFIGFDIQHNQLGQNKLLDYLKRVAPERADSTEAFFGVNLDSLNSVLSASDQQLKMQETLSQLQIKYNDLFVFLELNGPILIPKSSPAEYEQMREYARVLAQYVDSYSRPAVVGTASRDVYMADNFRRLVERESAGTKIVIWAHNGHISAGDNNLFVPMGAYLRQYYGNAYYALGFSFNQGSFQAREAQPTDSTRRMLMAFTTNPAPAGSVDWFLARTGPKAFMVDFRTTPQNADVRTWLTTPYLMRSVGSIYRPGAEQNFFHPVTIGDRFDGLLFIDTTTRARPNPSVKNVAGRAEK